MRCQTCPPFSPPQIPDTDAASPHERHDRSRSPPFPKKVRPGTRSSTVHSTVPDFTEDRLRFFLRPPFENFDIPEPIPSGRRSDGPLPSQHTVRSSRRRTTANTPATGCKRMQPIKIIVPYRHGSQSVRHGTPPYEPGELLSSISRPGTLPPRHSCPGSRSERKAFA